MAEVNLRISYKIILDIIAQLQKEYPEKSFISKEQLIQRLMAIPAVRRKRLRLDLKTAGFKGILHRLQELNLIEGQVIVDKGLRKMMKISEKGKILLDDVEFVREFIKLPVS